MKTMLLRAAILVAALAAVSAHAQVVRLPVVKNTIGAPTASGASVLIDSTGVEKGTGGNPVVTSCPACAGGGTATAAVPTYTEGATAQPLSLDLSGRLRVLSALTGTLPAFASVPTFSPQDLTPISVTPLAATGNLFCATNTAGYPVTSFQITGTFVATMATEVSNDSTNCTDGTWATSTWFSVTGSGGQINSSPFGSAQFGWILNTHKMTRIRVTAYTSGTVGATAYLRTLIPPYTTTMNLSGGTATIGSILTTLSAASGGGTPLATGYILTSAASTNNTLIITGAHRIVGGQLCNTTAALKFVKLYNKATAPTVGTDTPIFTVTIQPNACTTMPSMVGDFGEYFSLGIGFGITGAFATSDTTAVAAGDVIGTISYL